MTEQIGKITLDLSKYPGEDYYCDGAVEDELLQIVQTCPEGEYRRVIDEKKSWPILYHLSPLRENIVDFIPMNKSDKVLEVGSGCGAITGALARKAGSVTCVDLSKKRSMINAYRHQECENVTIHVGNFTDIEPDLPRDFQYICLIGVFEYGRGYIGGETPYHDFLKILMKHLAPGGRILIAIENKYGLKYFAGCTEDHLGTYFSGIENYKEQGTARTFSRKGLEKIFKECGVTKSHFYYPYPDYKFMTSVYSDIYLPGKGELSNNLRNYDRDRMLLFDEKSAYDGIVEEGLFSVFANSYMVVIGEDFPVKYVKYSNDRAPEFQIKTEITRDASGKVAVSKHPLSQAATEHVSKMAAAYEALKKRYAGSDLAVNRCSLKQDKGETYVEFEYVSGTSLAELMDNCLERKDIEGFYKLFDRYVELIGYHEEAEVADFDLVFSNLLVDGDEWTLIDYEWTFGQAMDTRELAYRAVYCYLLESNKRGILDIHKVMERLGITEQQAKQYQNREVEFQAYVEGKQTSMAVMRDLIGRKLMVPQKWIERMEASAALSVVQVYEDTGSGYQEETSYFVKDAYDGDTTIRLDLNLKGNVKMLRVDPAMDCGVCKVRELIFNGKNIPLHTSKLFYVNGKLIKNKTKDGKESVTAIFPTSDPNLNINMKKLSPKEENSLTLIMEMVRMPMDMVEDMV